MDLTAIKQDVNSLDSSVVVHELEFAMKRALSKVVYEIYVTNITFNPNKKLQSSYVFQKLICFDNAFNIFFSLSHATHTCKSFLKMLN